MEEETECDFTKTAKLGSKWKNRITSEKFEIVAYHRGHTALVTNGYRDWWTDLRDCDPYGED